MDGWIEAKTPRGGEEEWERAGAIPVCTGVLSSLPPLSPSISLSSLSSPLSISFSLSPLGSRGLSNRFGLPTFWSHSLATSKSS